MAFLTDSPERGAAAPATLTARFTAVVRGVSQAHAVIGGTVLLFLLPALLDVLSERSRPFGYLAPDSYYYFTIAANWVNYGSPSFDQVHPTNGFHPLWQWVVTLLYGAVTGLGFSRLALVPVVVVSCLVALSGAIVLLGLAQAKKGRVPLLFFLLPLGAWPVLISPVWWATRDQVPSYMRTPLFGTLWNFANGLESALLLLLFALLAWLYVKRPAETAARAALFGLALGALTLARLDHGVYAAALVGLPLAHHLWTRDRPRVILGLWTLLAWLAVLGAYLIYNFFVVGRFMPVSGAVKSTFPVPSSGSLNWILSFPSLPPRTLMYSLGRIGSITFPALTALLYFPFALRLRTVPGRISLSFRQGYGRFSELMLYTAVGTLGLAAYDFLFVVDWHIGEWYAPLSVLFVSLFAVQVAERVAQAWRLWRGRALGWGIAVVLCGVQLTYFFELHRELGWGKMYADFCFGYSPRVVKHYAGSRPRLLSREDGVIAFATGFPTTSGTGLALDAEAAKARSSGSFEPLLEQRGVDRVTSLYYQGAHGFRVGERSARVQKYAAGVLMAPPRRTYEVEYVDRGFGIMRALADGE